MKFSLRDHTHLLTVAGSRAYGMHTAASDIDLKGVAVPPARAYHGLLHPFEQADGVSEIAPFLADLSAEERAASERTRLEGAVYEMRKFLRLATSGNPNILDVLFCREAEVRLCTPVGRRLRDAREGFVTALCKHTYSGYATQQLKRIRLHWRWHHEGPEREPSRADFGLPEIGLMSRDQLAAAEATVRKRVEAWDIDWNDLDDALRIQLQEQVSRYLAELGLASESAHWRAAGRLIGLDDNFVELMQRERAYANARAEWSRYQEWKRDRNPERASLEARFGYDTKHAAHLVRLLRMGREILETGVVNVWRGDLDADELLAIRGGAWTYEQLLEWAAAQEAQLDATYQEGRFVVPRAPDREAIDRLCQELVEEGLRITPSAAPSAPRP